MLADSDRIFTNLYGEGDWHLAGARARYQRRGNDQIHRVLIGELPIFFG